MAVNEQIPNQVYIEPKFDMSDEKLISVADAWIQESKKYHSELEIVWKKNEQYYLGNQTDLALIPSDRANSVENHIFTGVETLVPIITANPPQFVVQPPEEGDYSSKYSKAVQDILGVHYETKDVRTNGEMLVRHLLIFRLGCWKIFWDEDENDVGLKYVRPQRLYFPKVSGRLPYTIEKLDITADEFKDLWGEDKFKEFLKQAGQEVIDEEVQNISGIWTIWEVWTEQFMFWKHGSMIIEKIKNPNFDFNDEKKNHFKKPKMPYILASAFKLGNSPVGETDLIQQTVPIQDDINVTKRVILNNAKKMGNGAWLIDSDVMSEEEARTKITNEEGLIIYGQGVANQNLLRRDTPPPIPEYIHQIYVESQRAFDNVFGTHSTTRGERDKSETATGRVMLKQGDLGRIDLIVREFERVVAEAGNWFVQLMKMNYEEKRTFKKYGETGVTLISFEPHMIESGISVLVKSGTTLPTDEVSKRAEALELWSLGAIGPVTLYQRLKFANPEEAAKELQAWKQGQLKMEAEITGALKQGPQRSPAPSMNPRGNLGTFQQNQSSVY